MIRDAPRACASVARRAAPPAPAGERRPRRPDPRQAAPVRYVTGDVTRPGPATGPRVLIHVCNDAGGFGQGVAGAIARRWPDARAQFKAWARGEMDGAPYALGRVQLVRVATPGDATGDPDLAAGLWVAHLVAQEGYGPTADGRARLSYPALACCLARVRAAAARRGAAVIAPRLGTGRAGGAWLPVAAQLEGELATYGIPVTVYTLAPRRPAA